MKKKYFILMLSLLILLPQLMEARKVETASCFQPHMVLQQERPITVWGTAAPGQRVEVSFDGETVKVKADKQGRWQAILSPRKASFQSKTLTVAGQKFEDILIGDVWFCSGQSNMDLRSRSCDAGTKNFPEDPERYKGLRILQEEGLRLMAGTGYKPEELERCNTEAFFQGKWQQTSPEVLLRCSAVASHFGLELQQRSGVPVGIIVCSLGASAVHSWIPEQVLRQHPLTEDWFDTDLLSNDNIIAWHKERIRKGFQKVMDTTKPYITGQTDYRSPCEPSFLYEASIPRFSRTPIRGVLWYQGESDVFSPTVLENYKTLLPLMIRSWREAFGDPDLPFLTIQLPSWKEQAWTGMRQVQEQVCRKVPYTYLVPTIDLGDPVKIHFGGKKEVGRRAALLAADKILHKSGTQFPMIRHWYEENGRMTVYVTDTEEPMHVTRPGRPEIELTYLDGSVDSVTVTPLPGKFHFAVDTLRTLSKVRYAWKANVLDESLLVSEDNIPLPPFEICPRTAPIFAPGEAYVPGKITDELIDRQFDTWDKEVPEVIENYRVQGHTRASMLFYEKDPEGFLGISRNFRKLGIDAFTRHAKSRGEDVWWKSSIPPYREDIAARGNIIEGITDSARLNGQKIILYHRHIEDQSCADAHPDWVNREQDGRKIAKVIFGSDHYMIPGGTFDKLCYNSPFVQHYMTRTKEIIRFGCDGLYFDEMHQPKQGCWCVNCRKMFKKEIGWDLPEDQSPDNPVYQALLEYKNVMIERTFRLWCADFKNVSPELAIIVSGNTWPGMAETHLENHLYRFIDSFKSEYSIGARNYRNKKLQFQIPQDTSYQDIAINSHGWVLARDAAEGRPSHIWCNDLTPKDAMWKMYSIIGHGCIANLDMLEREIPEMKYKPVFEKGKELSRVMQNTVPYRHVAVHYPERARLYVSSPKEASTNILGPHMSTYMTLKEMHVPVGILTDSELEDGLTDGYKVIFTVADSLLTPAERASLDDFKAMGGTVCRYMPSNATERSLSEDDLKLDKCPFRITGVDKKILTDFFRRPGETGILVNLMNPEERPGTGGQLVIDLEDGVKVPVLKDAVTGKALTGNVENGKLTVMLPEVKDFLFIEIE